MKSLDKIKNLFKPKVEYSEEKKSKDTGQTIVLPLSSEQFFIVKQIFENSKSEPSVILDEIDKSLKLKFSDSDSDTPDYSYIR
ncbi:MAG: hypothetical protein ACYCS1_05220 [Gammaproteobacteria bacterium]